MNFLRIALSFLLIQNAAPPPQTTSISGIVVEAGTGKPIANATIQLIATPSTPSSSPLSITARSSRNGTFSLTNLKPGDGLLAAMAPGYVSTIYSGSGTGRMVWTANQKLTNVRIELTPAGAISGRILNQQGDPMANIVVQAVQLSYVNGKRKWRVVESRPTNDLGEYRLFWLNPGRYFIRTAQGDTVETSINIPTQKLSINEKLDIQPPALIRSLANDGTISDEAVMPIYYPGTAEPGQAIPVEVRPGLTVRIDFQSSRVPVYRVRGRIMGNPVENGVGSTVRLVPLNSTGAHEAFLDDYLDLESLIEGDRFEIGGVPPGSYAVLVDLHRDRKSMSARTTIDVRNTDLNDLVVDPTPNVRVTGTFLIDGDTSDGKAAYLFTQFELRSKISDADSIEGLITHGSLIFENVPAGDYIIYSTSMSVEVPGKDDPFPAYVESMRAGDQDVLKNGLHVDKNFDQPIRIVVRNDFGSVSGRVIGSPLLFTEAVVVLVPTFRNERARYKTTGVDMMGEYHFTDVAPGEYKVFASDRSGYNAWQDPEFVAAHEVYGLDVRVSAGSDRSMDVPYIVGEPK